MFDFQSRFNSGLPYDDFLNRYGSESDRRRWGRVLDQVALTDDQRTLLASFRRQIRVLCLAGTWCGDCAAQCPILQRIALECSALELRFVDRDADPQLSGELLLCGSPRVPQVVFLDEDGNHLGRYGDRTLARYRQLVAQLAGATCSSGIVAAGSDLDNIVREWLEQIERMQWLLRTSPRLRERYGD
jgi:hypothetical protein